MPLDGLRLLDVGCGLGGMAGFLAGRSVSVDYVGIDLSPRMIELGRELHPELDLRVANILEEDVGEFDVAVASGIFYLLDDDAQELMRPIVDRMWAVSARAIGFNSLSAWAADREPGEFYADPGATLEMARELTPWVSLRHDYHPRDFTVFAYREPPS